MPIDMRISIFVSIPRANIMNAHTYAYTELSGKLVQAVQLFSRYDSDRTKISTYAYSKVLKRTVLYIIGVCTKVVHKGYKFVQIDINRSVLN